MDQITIPRSVCSFCANEWQAEAFGSRVEHSATNRHGAYRLNVLFLTGVSPHSPLIRFEIRFQSLRSHRKKMKTFLFACFFAISSAIVHAERPVQKYGDLYVENSHIKSSKTGEIVTLRGVSLGWSNWRGRFYNAGAVKSLVDNWNPSIIRVAIAVEKENGYLAGEAWREDTRQKLFAVVDACISEDVYVLIDWHAHTMKQPEAVAFFAEMSAKYGGHPHVLFEPWNEPRNSQNPSQDYTWPQIKSYHEAVLAAIREKDPDEKENIVVLGTPKWSSRTGIAAADPLVGFTNIAYTQHFYAAANNHLFTNKSQPETHIVQTEQALAEGVCVLVTECGAMDATGDGDIDWDSWNGWVDFLNEQQIGYIMWSLSDKNESCSMIRDASESATGPWADEDLKEWGVYVREHLNRFAEDPDGG